MQPASSSTNQPVTTQSSIPALTKKIHNSGQSIFLMGCFLIILGSIAMLGLNSLEESTRLMNGLYFALIIASSIYWIVAGTQIKRSTDNGMKALSLIRIVLITSVVCSVFSIVALINRGRLGVGDLTIIFTLYLLVAQSGIKKLVH